MSMRASLCMKEARRRAGEEARRRVARTPTRLLAFVAYSPLALSDRSDEGEHRHVHRDDDAADGDAEECDEHGLEQLHEAGHGGVDFFFVEVGDLREHRVERAG